MTQKERMLAGKLYSADDRELRDMKCKCDLLLDEFNSTANNDTVARKNILKKLFKSAGVNVQFNKPFYCDYGSNIQVGNNVYANFDCIFLDVNKIIIGDNVLFGPRVCIYTAGHPIDKDIRSIGLEFGKRVVIGNDVWIGGNTVINPGITIGNNVVIGSGTIVTKNIPSGVIFAGNPGKVIREITSEDKVRWNTEVEEYRSNSN